MASVSKIGGTTVSSPVLAGGVTNGSITTATARPYSLATMDADTDLKYDAINRTLQIESTLDDIFFDLGADVVYAGPKVSVPEACVMRVSSPADGVSRTQTIPLMNPLAGVARYGTDQAQQGYERATTLERMKIYYNEYSNAVIEKTWGMDYNDLQLFNYWKELQPALSKWFKEDTGKQYREAAHEQYSYVLEGTGTALTQAFQPNIFVANIAPGSQPTYSSTGSTHRTAMTTAFAAADTGTNGENANIDIDMLIALEDWAANTKRIEPVMVGGEKTYFLILPTPQWYKLINPIKQGQFGALWRDTSQFSSEEMKYRGVVGKFLSLMIVPDQRYPTITCANNYSVAATVTPTYCEPGNYDQRNKSPYLAASNASWDVGFLFGKGAIWDWTVRPLHFETETTEYGKLVSTGGFTERGIQSTFYDLDTAGNAVKDFSKAVCYFTAANNYTTI